MVPIAFPGKTLLLVSASTILLSACGGSGDSSESRNADASSTSSSDTASSNAAAEVETAAATMADDAEDMAEEAEDMADSAADKVANATRNAASNASDSADQAAGAVEDAVADAADEVNATAAAMQDSGGGDSEYASLTGDADRGKRVFARCMACHTVQEGQNRVGPSLYGIVGREAGSVEGFNYSDANANSGITWTEEVMFEYLEAPQEYIPGTRMIFPGLPSAQDRADVIAYLKSVPE